MAFSHISPRISANRYWEIWSRQDRVIEAIQRVVSHKRRKNIVPARAMLAELKNVLDEKDQREALPYLEAFGVVNKQKTVNSYSYAIVPEEYERFKKTRSMAGV